MAREADRERWFERLSLDNPKTQIMALNKIMQGILSGEIAQKRAGQMIHEVALAIYRPRENEMRNSE